MRLLRDSTGYTLTELVVVMLIFTVLTIIASSAFENIYRTSRQQERIAQSNIEGVVGLEMLRADIAHAGFGLPWVFGNMSTMTYSEADMAADAFAKGINPNDYNDAPRAPRAVIVGAATKYIGGASGRGPDYLVIKSTRVATNDTARRWTYFVYSSSAGLNKSYLRPRIGNENYALNDRVIAVEQSFDSHGRLRRNLLVSGSDFHFRIDGSDPPDAFKPGDRSRQVVTYGLFNASSTNPRMPFNRADYYVQRPTSKMPESCNAGTGVLYKSVVNHSSGGFSPIIPLLNCVGDMKVIFLLDMNEDGTGGTFVDPATSDGSVRSGSETTSNADVAETLTDASLLRKRLKEVSVYILAHEGGRDRNYTYPVSDSTKAVIVGDSDHESVSRVWSESDMAAVFGQEWRQYRWKLYRIIVAPTNLS